MASGALALQCPLTVWQIVGLALRLPFESVAREGDSRIATAISKRPFLDIMVDRIA